MSSFSNSEADLISVSWMNEASNAVKQIVSQITNYKGNHNTTHLNNAVSQLDTILNTTAKVNLIKSKQSFRNSTKALETHIAQIDEIVKNYSSKLVEANDINIAIEDRCNKLSEDINAQSTKFTNEINSEKIRLDQLAATYQSKMLEDQEKYSKSLQEDREKFLLEIQNSREEKKMLIEQIKSQSEEQQKKFSEDAHSLIEANEKAFDTYKKKTEDIVGLLSTDATSYKYRQVADDSHKRARFWHRLAIILMISVAAFSVYAFVITTNQGSDWVKLVAKIFATTTMATSAAYAARQASKQEKVERFSRKIEMELVAFDPFVSSLDDNLQGELKAEIAKRIFGNKDNMEINDADEAHHAFDKTISVEDLIKTVINLVGKK